MVRYPIFLNFIDSVAGGGKLYLQMVYTQTTYMGCGIIGYTEYAYHDNNANLIYNVSFNFLSSFYLRSWNPVRIFAVISVAYICVYILNFIQIVHPLQHV